MILEIQRRLELMNLTSAESHDITVKVCERGLKEVNAFPNMKSSTEYRIGAKINSLNIILKD